MDSYDMAVAAVVLGCVLLVALFVRKIGLR